MLGRANVDAVDVVDGMDGMFATQAGALWAHACCGGRAPFASLSRYLNSTRYSRDVGTYMKKSGCSEPGTN